MSYIVGFVSAVPTAKKDEFLSHAKEAAVLLKEFGATRVVEAWGDTVFDGEVTDFKKAVKAKADETVVFSWHEYPSKDVADKAYETMMQDERMMALGKTMPFDGKRMIIGTFNPLLDV